MLCFDLQGVANLPLNCTAKPLVQGAGTTEELVEQHYDFAAVKGKS